MKNEKQNDKLHLWFGKKDILWVFNHMSVEVFIRLLNERARQYHFQVICEICDGIRVGEKIERWQSIFHSGKIRA